MTEHWSTSWHELWQHAPEQANRLGYPSPLQTAGQEPLVADGPRNGVPSEPELCQRGWQFPVFRVGACGTVPVLKPRQPHPEAYPTIDLPTGTPAVSTMHMSHNICKGEKSRSYRPTPTCAHRSPPHLTIYFPSGEAGSGGAEAPSLQGSSLMQAQHRAFEAFGAKPLLHGLPLPNQQPAEPGTAQLQAGRCVAGRPVCQCAAVPEKALLLKQRLVTLSGSSTQVGREPVRQLPARVGWMRNSMLFARVQHMLWCRRWE